MILPILMVDLIGATVSVTPESARFRETEYFTLRAQTDSYNNSTFQWFKNGLPITDATESILRVFQADLADVGTYHVELSNPEFETISSNKVPVSLIHRRAPVFLDHPDPQTLDYNDWSLHLDCRIEDETGVTFQWFRNDAPLPNTNWRSQRFDSITGDPGVDLPGRYYVEASNIYGTTRSQEIIVTVDPGKAPVFTLEPWDVQLRPVDIISIFAGAVGEPTPEIQWFHNDEPISGTGSSLRLEGDSPTVAGTYYAIATNRFGTTTSRTATVVTRPNDPPVVTHHPANLRLAPLQSGELRVSAAPGTAFTYAWFKNGSLIEDADQYYLDLPGDGNAAGTYHVVLSNESGTATSNDAVVTIHTAETLPVIATHSGDMVAIDGQTMNPHMSFHGVATSIRWFFETEPLPEFDNVASPALLASPERVGNYTATVTTAEGTETSDPIRLSLRTPIPPFFATSLSRVIERDGADNYLTIEAKGEYPIDYQWFKDDELIEGLSLSRLDLNALGHGYAGTYHVLASNAGGDTRSESIVINELQLQAPRIDRHSGNLTRTEDYSPQHVALEAHVSGNFVGMTLQWFKENEPIEGANNWRLAVNPSESPGTYTLTATNSVGSATTEPIIVSYLSSPEMPTVEFPGAEFIGYLGGDFDFPVTSSGTGDFTFTWMKDNRVIEGQTEEVLTLRRLSTEDAGTYTVLIEDDIGIVASSPATLVLREPTPPRFDQQPGSQQISLGSAAQLVVTASGDPAPTIQWFKNGVLIPGANDSLYTIESVEPADLGNYTVTIDNGFGTIRSGVGELKLSLQNSDLAGTQTSGNHHYLPEIPFTILNEIHYRNDVQSLHWQVLLPEGWSVISTQSENDASSAPAPGTTDLAEWTWTPAPPSSFTFSYQLLPPVSATSSVEVTTLLESTIGDTILQTLAVPSPLEITPWPDRHTADTDNDARLNLSELLRVIELYNARVGSTRLGRYRSFVGSIDGFESDSTTLASYRYSLRRYHAADTNRDGSIDLSELLRVIEIYNTRSGTSRTGAYHRATGTVDGFAPGPGGE